MIRVCPPVSLLGFVFLMASMFILGDISSHICLASTIRSLESNPRPSTKVKFNTRAYSSLGPNRKDEVIERVSLQAYQKHGDCWLLSVVKQLGVRK